MPVNTSSLKDYETVLFHLMTLAHKIVYTYIRLRFKQRDKLICLISRENLIVVIIEMSTNACIVASHFYKYPSKDNRILLFVIDAWNVLSHSTHRLTVNEM